MSSKEMRTMNHCGFLVGLEMDNNEQQNFNGLQ
jgi:hypothetical protein